MKKTETHYHHDLSMTEYDFLDVVEDTEGRITVKFLDTRWRTKAETIAVFKEIIAQISKMD